MYVSCAFIMWNQWQKEKKIFDCHQHAKTELNEEKGFKSYDMKRKKKFNFIEFFTFSFIYISFMFVVGENQQHNNSFIDRS